MSVVLMSPFVSVTFFLGFCWRDLSSDCMLVCMFLTGYYFLQIKKFRIFVIIGVVYSLFFYVCRSKFRFKPWIASGQIYNCLFSMVLIFFGPPSKRWSVTRLRVFSSIETVSFTMSFYFICSDFDLFHVLTVRDGLVQCESWRSISFYLM